MAYNLESLVKILEQILHPDDRDPWTLDPNKKPEVESLLEKALFLKEFFGNSSGLTGDKIESLESRIRDAAHEAEDVLESHLVDRILSVGEGVNFTISPPSLHKVIGDFDSAEEEIKKMMDGSHIPDSSSPAAAFSRTDPNPKKILVGLSRDSIQLKDRLTGQEPKLEIIPIVGMGGIGKTTLARNAYDDPLVASHFDTRAWITISQEYNVRAILLGLLGCVIGKLTDEILQKENVELGVHLHRSLWGIRYLIVLDDMWDNKPWDDLKWFFPDDKINSSRVMLTTRELSVANYAGSNSCHHQMQLLNKDDSWNLLRQKVFAEETCPSELEKIGEKIGNSCRGLPLAIHVIGGVLSQVKRTRESWLQVAKDVTSIVAHNDEQFSKILSLSYNHLPNHLKPCFLYMGAFPEDYEIRSSKLIRLLVAEGFLKPVPDKSLEEAAEMHLKALVDRNLIFVRQQETNGIVKSYGIHDLLRDLSVLKARQEKFLYIKNWKIRNLPEDTLCLRRVSIHSSYKIRVIYASMELMSFARSFICVGTAAREILSPVFFALRLLRVLDVFAIEFHRFPEEMLQLVNLRYLAFVCHSHFLPLSLSKLCNLQTLVCRLISTFGLGGPICVILDMPRLRHIKFKDRYAFWGLPYGERLVLQEHLQTLSDIKVHDDFDRIIESFPNLKKLGIFCHVEVSFSVDLTCLRRLETLKCSSNLSPEGQHVLSSLIFPPSLKKLTLNKCRIPLGYMNKMGTLPNLEVLKLRNSTLESSTWEPTEGEFCRLQFLLLENLNLVNWEADESHFPRLERLIIRDCSKLEEIPSGIGEISTLEIIEVYKSSPSAVASARKIQEEQLELGNYGLQVLISGS